MRYMVVECHLSYAVVLSEDGRFLKTANLQYQVGQTVEQIVEMAPAPARRKKRWGGLAALAACLVLMVSTLFSTNYVTFASVYISINPEVRIDVNRKENVLALEGLNPDGVQLVEGYSYRNKHLDLVVDELVDRAIQMGYLHAGGQVTISLDSADSQWLASTGPVLSQHLNQHLSESLTVAIQVEDHRAAAPSPTPVPPLSVPVYPGEYHDSDYGEPTPAASAPPAGSSPAYQDGMTDYDEPEPDSASPYDEPEDSRTPYRESHSPYDDPEDDREDDSDDDHEEDDEDDDEPNEDDDD